MKKKIYIGGILVVVLAVGLCWEIYDTNRLENFMVQSLILDLKLIEALDEGDLESRARVNQLILQYESLNQELITLYPKYYGQNVAISDRRFNSGKKLLQTDWNKVKKGMSLTQVMNILGDPILSNNTLNRINDDSLERKRLRYPPEYYPGRNSDFTRSRVVTFVHNNLKWINRINKNRVYSSNQPEKVTFIKTENGGEMLVNEDGCISLAWECSRGAYPLHYELEVIQPNSKSSKAVKLGALRCLLKLKTAGEYTCRVKAINGFGHSEWSAYSFIFNPDKKGN